MNFEFTDKTQESIAAAIQLAKDYSHAQGMSTFRLYSVSRGSRCPSVHPAHIAAALLNEEGTGGSVPGSLSGNGKSSLFSSVIQKAGGDPVRIYPIFIHL